MFRVKIEKTEIGAVAGIYRQSGRASQAEALRFAADVEDLSGGRLWKITVAAWHLGALPSEVRITLGEGPRGADTVEEAVRVLRLVELERARAAFYASVGNADREDSLRRLEDASPG